MPIGLPSPLPTATIHCPDCGVECNYVANCFAEMPFSYPGNYHPHQKGSQGCLERQIRNLKTRIKQLNEKITEEVTGKKFVILLELTGFSHQQAVVIDNTPEEAVMRARLFDPNGGWEHASVTIITRVRATRTARVLAMDKMNKQEGPSPLVLEEIYHAGWAAIVHYARQAKNLSETELSILQRLQSALEPIQTKVNICNPYDTVLDEFELDACPQE